MTDERVNEDVAALVQAAEDVVAWETEQQAASGVEMLFSLRLRIERLRAALAAHDATDEGEGE